LIENIGSVLACIGAIFNCKPGRKEKRIGFSIWIISNILLALWAISIQAWFPTTMYALFTMTASYGLYHHRDDPIFPTEPASTIK
jgi:hypothetical protein